MPGSWRRRQRLAALFLLAAGLAAGPMQGQILYRYDDGEILFDGMFGPVIEAQRAINRALTSCRMTLIVPDGKFGTDTRDALVRLASCPAYVARLGDDAEARAGALTVAAWRALLASDPPSLDQRARTMMLTQEATDYTKAEWNFCQNEPAYDPPKQAICYSDDRHSYLTWGPNGATAGNSREIQLILGSIDAEDPAPIRDAFGDEADSLRRMFHIPDEERALETYLCGIWADPDRRAAWRTGFERIGEVASVRARFDLYYRSVTLDGGKIATFFQAYRASGIEPTEIDYAFFKDRAAHMTVHYAPLHAVLADFLQRNPGAPHWRIRQAIALGVRPSNQREDRLGRDVAFYVDGAGGSLSDEESLAWSERNSLRASNFGLSDARSGGTFEAGPELSESIADPAEITPAERAACPQAVLDAQPPPPLPED